MAATRFDTETLKVEQLLLDKKNPRIPLDKQQLSQEELVAYIAENYFALTVARSIVAHEFFPSEPLIAIPGSKAGEYIVVEGNRRLAALKLLSHPELRQLLPNHKEWDELPAANVPTQVPVVVVKKRRDVAPIIGYRHISGIQQWDADAKARYIANQIDDEGLSFKDTAKEVGETEYAVRTHYRNHRIALQAEKQTGKAKIDPEALNAMKRDFGTFTRAMTGNIAKYVGAPTPADVKKGQNPIPAKKKDALKEMVEMLFGPTKVLEESRDVTDLGKAIATKEGLEMLRKTRNLEESVGVSGGVLDRIIQKLSHAARDLRAVKDDFPKHKKDADVLKLLNDCAEALRDLQNAK